MSNNKVRVVLFRSCMEDTPKRQGTEDQKERNAL